MLFHHICSLAKGIHTYPRRSKNVIETEFEIRKNLMTMRLRWVHLCWFRLRQGCDLRLLVLGEALSSLPQRNAPETSSYAYYTREVKRITIELLIVTIITDRARQWSG